MAERFNIKVFDNKMVITVDNLKMTIDDDACIVDGITDIVVLPVDMPFMQYTIFNIIENLSAISGYVK